MTDRAQELQRALAAAHAESEGLKVSLLEAENRVLPF